MTNWVDFSSIKRSVSIAPLLRQYRVQLRRSGRDQYRGCCPIHGGEGRDAFHVNLTRNIFHCFACGASGTVLDFIAAMERCSLREAALKLAHADTSMRQPAASCPTQLVTKESKPLAPLGFALRGIDSQHPYLATRGIQTSTAEQFGIGFYRGAGIFSGRLVIPIHDKRGQLVAYCGRAVDATRPRYRFPPGFAKSEAVFNLHRALAVWTQIGCPGGRFFRLCEAVASGRAFGGRSDGLGFVRATATRAAPTLPPCDLDAGWRCCRQARHP